jgi:hypothetical protein
VRKNCPSDLEKLLKFEAEGQEFEKNLRSQEQFYSNIESSEQFLVTECFLNSNSNWKKSLRFRKMQKKLENYLVDSEKITNSQNDSST